MRLVPLVATVWLTAAAAHAGMVVQTWGPGKNASHPDALKIADAGDGATIEVDLAALPKGAKVFGARLFMQRSHVTIPQPTRGEEAKPVADGTLVPCEVYAGKKADGKPLEIVGPWFDCLNATEAVAASAGGPCVFFVKPLPDWKKAGTFLEVSYESQTAEKPGPQAAGLKVVHRAGQTFIAFKEIEDVAGADEVTWENFQKLGPAADSKRQVRYHVFRAARPITAETLAQAERIAVVAPLSGWNANGRNSERPIDTALATLYAYPWGHWNPFGDARVDGQWGKDCPIDRFVIPSGGREGAESGGRLLARDEGLYVNTVKDKAKAYYAIVVSVNGTANTADFAPGNSLQEAVEEVPAACEPVFQRELPPTPFWSYPEKRLHYVHWAAEPFGNLPSQYYNWSVAVPNEPVKDGAATASAPTRWSVELSLPREDRSYWRTQYRIERDSIVLTPYDLHSIPPAGTPVETWWYGYHEALGTLKSFQQGVVHNYTEQRLLWFVDWACRKWPTDRNRILVTAMRRSSGGGGASWSTRGCSTSGALHLGLRHADIFSSVLIGSYARPDYAADVAPSMIQIWGKPEWGIKTDTGKNVWEELNLVKLVKDLPASQDLPLVTTTGKGVTDSERALFNALLAKGEPVMANFGYWGGPKLLPVSFTGTWPQPMMRIDVRRNLALPVFRAVSLEKAKGTTPDIPADAEKPYGTINAQLRWSGADVVDQAGRIELTLWAEGRPGETVTSDVIVRRLSGFKPAAGLACHWEYGPKDGAKQSGEFTVGPDALLVVPAVKIANSPGRLVVTAK